MKHQHFWKLKASLKQTGSSQEKKKSAIRRQASWARTSIWYSVQPTAACSDHRLHGWTQHLVLTKPAEERRIDMCPTTPLLMLFQVIQHPSLKKRRKKKVNPASWWYQFTASGLQYLVSHWRQITFQASTDRYTLWWFSIFSLQPDKTWNGQI